MFLNRFISVVTTKATSKQRYKAMIELCEYTGNLKEWDAFVESHPESRFFQLIGYKNAIEETYGYASKYLLVRNGSEVVAVLPAFILNSPFGNRRLISSPFAEYGGFLGVNLAEEDVQEIVSQLRATLQTENITYLEIHGGLGIPTREMQAAFVEKPMYRYAILELRSADEVWEEVMDYQARKAVRKAEKANLRAYQEVTEETIRRKFYPLYLMSMKRLGTPPHPQRLFLNYLRHLPENLKIVFVDTQDEQTIAGLMGFVLSKRIHIIHTVSDPEHWDKRPNDLAHWELIKWGCENGYELFDFATVRYEGQARFKKKWGVQLHDYSYYYLFPEADVEKEITPVDDSLWTIRAFAWLWRRCVPLKVTRFFGATIRKRLGR